MTVYDPLADPLDPVMRRRVDAAAAAVIDFVNGEDLRVPKLVSTRIRHGAGLTTTEARVLDLLRAGQHILEVAVELGVADSTAYGARDRLRLRGLI